MSLLWTALVMGLLGGFHCIGMCGPIALALPKSEGSSTSYTTGRILYNMGRVVTYALLGAAVGLFGLSLNLAGWQQGLSILSGILILLLQFAPGNLSGKLSLSLRLPLIIGRIKKLFSKLIHRKGGFSLFLIGLLNGILPCGLVYLALAGAIGTGSVSGAASYMILFGLGTIPLMLILSLTGRMISSKLKNKIEKLVPYIVAIIALLFILRGLSLGIPYISPKLATPESEITVCH